MRIIIFYLGYIGDKLRPNEEYAVLRMFGVTEGGNSVMVHIHQFLSYFYVELNDNLQTKYDPSIHNK